MIGKPKYKLGDSVTFSLNKKLKGVVYVVDKFGTFDDDSDVSYDIYVEEEKCLYKHINERLIDEI